MNDKFKLLSKKILLLGAMSICNARVHAVPIKPDEITNRKVVQSPRTITIDDYLIDMAHAVDVNIIADSTSFSPSSGVSSYPSTPGAIAGLNGKDKEKWSPRLINVMGDFAAQKKLSVLRPDPRTFLFWTEPEPRELFNLQLSAIEANDASLFAESLAVAQAEDTREEDIIRGPLPDSKLRRVLLDFLKTRHGWGGSSFQRNSNVDLRIPLTELPPGLRALVFLNLRQQFISPMSLLMLEDDFWHKAERRIFARKEGNSTLLEIPFEIPSEDGMSLSRSSYVLTVPDNAGFTIAPDAGLLVPAVKQHIVSATRRNVLPDAYSNLSDDVSNPLLDADPKLQIMISLEVRRKPLTEILMELQKQTRVHLVANEALFSTKLVTAHVDKISLAKFLKLLSRLHGVKWAKAGDWTAENSSYIMQSNDRGELNMKLLQVGDPARYRFRFLFYNRSEREQAQISIGRAVIENVGLKKLLGSEGIVISELPKNLQERLRSVLEEPVIDSLNTLLYRVNQMTSEEIVNNVLVLRFGNSVSQDYRTPFYGFARTENPKTLRFTVESKDGKIVVPVFDSIVFSVDGLAEQNTRKPSRRR